jgi:hypothetical protein
MRLELSILMGLVACFFTGICLLKGQALWDWSLKRRAYLRYGAAFCITKYRGFDRLTGYFKRNNPFEIVIQFVKHYRKQKMDKEIFESITFLRNLASIEKGKTTSSDYIIEKLAEHNGLLV